jgi:hypothetical protein
LLRCVDTPVLRATGLFAVQCRGEIAHVLKTPLMLGRSPQSREVGVGIMGNKAGMTSYFTDKGMQVPVTVIALLPGNVVTQARVSPAAGQAAACCPRRRHQRWTRPAAWRRAAGCVRRWPGSRV